MVVLKRTGLVWSLLLCLVLVNGFMTAPSVAHAAHHASHKAGTHTTGFCAWFCAAGQGVETPSVNFESALQLVGRTEYLRADQITHLFSAFIFLRGPPSFSAI